jgi:hypothetical protein
MFPFHYRYSICIFEYSHICEIADTDMHSECGHRIIDPDQILIYKLFCLVIIGR